MNRTRILPLVALLLIGLVAGGYYFLVREDTATKASLGNAPLVNVTTTSGAAADSADGTWTVVPGANVFGGYRIHKVLAGVDQEVTGRSPNITGSLTMSGSLLETATFELDMKALDSGQSLRDQRMTSEGLETNTFPTATLAVSKPFTLPSTPKQGETVDATVPGELTLHGVTKAVQLTVQARWNGPTLDITASAPIALADYSIAVPAVPGATVADAGVLEAQIALARS
jgi:polyisoprenoid-binding protein YceI